MTLVETIKSYIQTCETLIAQHMLIEDPEDRQRAVDAQYGMKTDFERMLAELGG